MPGISWLAWITRLPRIYRLSILRLRVLLLVRIRWRILTAGRLSRILRLWLARHWLTGILRLGKLPSRGLSRILRLWILSGRGLSRKLRLRLLPGLPRLRRILRLTRWYGGLSWILGLLWIARLLLLLILLLLLLVEH